MKALKPGEMVFDEAASIEVDALLQHWPFDLESVIYNGRLYGQIDLLALQLGRGQVTMRNKQGIFQPKRLAVLIAVALRTPPPPALVVQFNNKGEKTTFPQYA